MSSPVGGVQEPGRSSPLCRHRPETGRGGPPDRPRPQAVHSPVSSPGRVRPTGPAVRAAASSGSAGTPAGPAPSATLLRRCPSPPPEVRHVEWPGAPEAIGFRLRAAHAARHAQGHREEDPRRLQGLPARRLETIGRRDRPKVTRQRCHAARCPPRSGHRPAPGPRGGGGQAPRTRGRVKPCRPAVDGPAAPPWPSFWCRSSASPGTRPRTVSPSVTPTACRAFRSGCVGAFRDDDPGRSAAEHRGRETMAWWDGARPAAGAAGGTANTPVGRPARSRMPHDQVLRMRTCPAPGAVPGRSVVRNGRFRRPWRGSGAAAGCCRPRRRRRTPSRYRRSSG